MNIRDYLKENKFIITDGAMGTYYSQISGKGTTFSELSNETDPKIIEKIHLEYIKAGAKLLRTNTFSINRFTLKINKEQVKSLIYKAYDIANNLAKDNNVFVGASIGPIITSNEEEKKMILEEYKYIVDCFLEKGADIFIFETFSSLDFLEEVVDYIKLKNKYAFILIQFAIMVNGRTRRGIGFNKLIEQVKKNKKIDSFGFNCGTGPTHLFNNLKNIEINEDIISVLPNAGFPEIINERMVYSQNPEYYSEIMKNIYSLGIKILGGCCGTTPLHIKALADKLNANQSVKYIKENKEKEIKKDKSVKENIFKDKLKNNEFVIAVELDPPFGIDTDKIMNAANDFIGKGIDVITISDSPIGKVRVNSITMALKIKRETGIETMPHYCCRDRNIIAMKSDLLGAHVDGIRNILLVTGDPIPSAERSEIKSVFNLNSMGLIDLVSEMNKEVFESDPFCIGGALNLNVKNKKISIKRMMQKVESGGEYYLTQPIYDFETIEFIKNLKKDKKIKILAGLMPVVSYRNAQFLNNEFSGITIPEKYVKEFREEMTREEAEEVGVKIIVEIAKEIKDYVDGFYFITPFNRSKMILKILDELKISNNNY